MTSTYFNKFRLLHEFTSCEFITLMKHLNFMDVINFNADIKLHTLTQLWWPGRTSYHHGTL